MREHFEQLYFTEGGNRKLEKESGMGQRTFLFDIPEEDLTPSFSLCINIFFKAKIAPFRLDLAL